MNKLNRIFTPGPVPIDEHILSIGAQQPPYNRTGDFSLLTHEILSSLKHLFQTDGEVALLTGSGTLAMEAAVLNFLTPYDKVLIVNGGTFGQRWCDLCRIHSIPFREIKLDAGADLDLDQLKNILGEVGRIYAPYLIANASAVAGKAEKLEMVLDGKAWVQNPFTYQAKCLQWLREAYSALSESDRARVDNILDGTGILQLFE